MSLTSWFLVSSGGTKHRLPREMIFVGRDDCELMLQSRSVDKQHAVINYEMANDEHKVKDLGSLNGTFVNDVRIQEQTYITLKIDDKLRFGYDTNLFTVERGELHVPEEALKHEKFTSQLQLGKKPPVVEPPKAPKTPKPASTKTPERKAAEPIMEPTAKPAEPQKGEEKTAVGDISALHRGTPLYGQPSWWGDGDADDENSFKQETKTSGKKQENCGIGSKHEDGTQSDSENGPGLRFGSRRQALEERLRAVAAASGRGPSPASSTTSRTSFMVELYDEDNPRKRRSYSFSQTAPLLGGGASTGEGLCPTPPPARPKVATMATEAAGKGSPSPLTSARVLQKQRSEEPGAARSSVGTGKSASPTEETHKQDGDDQSDKGTYTIELENRNPEEEEARRMIDKVFGVQGGQDGSCGDQQQGEGKPSESKKPSSKTAEVVPDDQVAVGSPHWVSQWASLTANHTRTDPEGSGAEPSTFVHQEREPNAFDSSLSQRSAGSTPSSLTERKRRTLPQLPAEEKPKLAALGLRSEIGEKQDTEPQEKENHSEHKGDGQSLPSSEGKMGTANGVALEGKGPLKRSTEEARRRRAQEGRWSGSESGEKSGRPLVRQGSFTIERPSGSVKAELIPIISRGDGSKGRERSDSTGSMDTATLLKDTEAVMAFLEAKLRDDARQEKQPSGATVSAASSSSVSKSHHRQRAGSISPESDVDTASTVSQAAGEGERKPAPVKRRSLSSLHREKSNASASSVATTRATAASARDRLERKAKTRTPSQALSSTTRHGRQPSLDLTDDDLTSSHPLSTMSDVLSSDQDTSSIRSYGRGGHFASTDDLMFSRTSSSAKISRSNKAFQGSTGSLAGKQSQQVQQQQQALPLPRPTRASLLRRARLGDTSDTDLADMDRVSVASEVSTTSSTSRPPSGRKAPSRIDMLAQPRRTRLGSMSARSDSEATVGVRNTATRLSAETALRLGLRQPMPGDGKLTAKSRASSISKLNDVKAKVTPPTHGSPSESPEPDPEAFLTAEEMMVSSRWRRLTPEYASTSEDEFGSNRNLSKHGRPLRTPPTLRGSRMGGSGSAPATPGAGSGVLKHRMREHDEYIRDWTAHSEEIARLFPCVRRISQDLAKDLAVLAREIHDVAGEIDSVSSSGTAPSTTLSTAATTPGSAIDTREEVRGQLVDRVFDESLNFRKIPPMVQPKAPEINGRPVELRPRAPDSLDSAALRRRTWNRDEAVLDSLLLTSVSQLSAKIRHSVDKTASKIRILFKDKDRNWDDIESKLRAESDIPLLKTSNKEISSILLELKRVEKQLQVINVMVDPDGTLDALTSLGLTSPVLFKPRTSPSSQTPPAPLPGPGATKAPAGATSPGDCQRDLGLSFTRTLPSGKEAAAVASK
ncbi:centrosomal protein of 170 kDa isoform X7 [Clupea harengus]|uniref:Centrosomal protein of 170 kDa isoform X7 n=1 Tax=Clupea harengus TaxID=7950 RepID=A0A6P3WEW0_CLUHA|nr:centrosomal protein of 170 kDa isoform X7 [Clupea harengus]